GNDPRAVVAVPARAAPSVASTSTRTGAGTLIGRPLARNIPNVERKCATSVADCSTFGCPMAGTRSRDPSPAAVEEAAVAEGQEPVAVGQGVVVEGPPPRADEGVDQHEQGRA